MNIYINHLPQGYCAGTIIVAANNEEQADEIYYRWLIEHNEMNVWTDNYSRLVNYNEFCTSEDRTDSRYYYQQNTWTQLPNATYNGDNPIVLDEENYID